MNIDAFYLLEPLIVRQEIKIKNGQNVVIRRKRIQLMADVYCEGSLRLENCLILYGNPKGGTVMTTKLELFNCIIECVSNGVMEDEFFVNGTLFFPLSFTAKNCVFRSCRQFIMNFGANKLDFDRCVIENIGSGFIQGLPNGTLSIQNSVIYRAAPAFCGNLVITAPNLVLKNTSVRDCVFRESDVGMIIVTETSTIQNCDFLNCAHVIKISAGSAFVENSRFENCDTPIQGGLNNYDHCYFQSSTNSVLTWLSDPATVNRCTFLGCYGAIMQLSNGTTVQNCKLYGTILSEDSILFNKAGTVRDCIFDGVIACGYHHLINSFEYRSQDWSFLPPKPGRQTEIINSSFSHFTDAKKLLNTEGIINVNYPAFHARIITTMRVISCRGLDKPSVSSELIQQYLRLKAPLILTECRSIGADTDCLPRVE